MNGPYHQETLSWQIPEAELGAFVVQPWSSPSCFSFCYGFWQPPCKSQLQAGVETCRIATWFAILLVSHAPPPFIFQWPYLKVCRSGLGWYSFAVGTGRTPSAYIKWIHRLSFNQQRPKGHSTIRLVYIVIGFFAVWNSEVCCTVPTTSTKNVHHMV